MRNFFLIIFVLLFFIVMGIIVFRPGPWQEGNHLSQEKVSKAFAENGFIMINEASDVETPWLTNKPNCWEGKTLASPCQDTPSIYCSWEHVGDHAPNWTERTSQDGRTHSEDTISKDLYCYYSSSSPISKKYLRVVKDLRALSRRGEYAGWMD